jgi:hypothetical protein
MQFENETELNQTLNKKVKNKNTKPKTKKLEEQLSQNVDQILQKNEVSEEISNKNEVSEEISDKNEISEEISEEISDKNEVSEETSNEVSEETSVVNSDEQFYDNSEYLSNLDKVLESLTYLNNNKITNYEIDKQFILNVQNKLKKINKLYLVLNEDILTYLFKSNLSCIKKNYKSSKNPKKIDKDKCPINILSDTYPEVLSFLSLSDNTKISKALVMQQVNSYVKEEKQNKNPDILVEGDNRSFKIGGKLLPLFEFIKKQMIERNDLLDENLFPKQIMYTQLMKYLKYCFLPK